MFHRSLDFATAQDIASIEPGQNLSLNDDLNKLKLNIQQKLLNKG